VAKLGTKRRPAVVRVRTEERAMEILDLCNEHGIQVIIGIEPDEQENISDVERILSNLLVNAAKFSPTGAPVRVTARVDVEGPPRRQRHR